MEFLYEYGLFLAKAVTFLVTIAILLAIIVAATQKNKDTDSGCITVKKLNEKYDDLKQQIKLAVIDECILKAEAKAAKQQEKLEKKQKKKAKTETEPKKKRVYVLNFDGDIKASAVENLREEITALLTMAEADDEVILRLESAGGMVHSYGLASSQLARIKERGIPLTVCVDKVAASGGYMMACVANKVCAAPFAIVGSIGVVAQLPNFHRLLKKNDVDFELLTAGEYKRTLTMFGENTEKGKEKFKEDLETTHQLFKQFVSDQRPVVDINKVATGEIWFGSQALEHELVDILITSDDYISQQADNANIYELTFATKKSLPERLGISLQQSMEGIITGAFNKLQSFRFM